MTDSSKSFSISDAILIALAPAIFYLFSYSFEKGYCAWFKLPTELISIDLINLLSIGGIMSTIVILLIVFLLAFPDRGTRVVLRSLTFPSFTGLVAWILYQSNAFILIKIPFYLLFILSLWYDLLKPIVLNKGSLIDRLELQVNVSEAREIHRIQRSIIGVKIKQLIDEGIDFKWIFRLYWILYSGLLISYMSGYGYASNQRTFIIVPDKPEILYLRKWGDHLIGMQYDSLHNKLKDNIFLLPINNQTSHIFNTINIKDLMTKDEEIDVKANNKLEGTLNKTNSTEDTTIKK